MSSQISLGRPSWKSSQEDCLPFLLDDEPTEQDGSSSVVESRGSIRSTYGFSVDNKVDKSSVSSPSRNVGAVSRFSNSQRSWKASVTGMLLDVWKIEVWEIGALQLLTPHKDPWMLETLMNSYQLTEWRGSDHCSSVLLSQLSWWRER